MTPDDPTAVRAEHDHSPWDAHGDSLGAVLASRGRSLAGNPYIHLVGDDGTTAAWTFDRVAALADRAAASLRAAGVGPGDRVMLVLPTGEGFLAAFFGAMRLGAVAVPCYPPARKRGLTDYQDRLARLVTVAAPRVIVTFDRARLVVEAAAHAAGSHARVLAGLAPAGPYDGPFPGGDDVALIQFSSGSTGDPRGVVLTHRQVLANVAAVLDVIRPGPADVNCSWLPLYHDMGLIGGLFMPLFAGNPLVLLSPQSFLLAPRRWLQAIHDHRATISTAPNFAYQLVATRLDDAELRGLDLACWRLALCGAEPVVPATLAAFAARMAPYGFDAAALTPVYGLAEMALAAVFPTPGAGVTCHEGHASVGRPLPGFGMRVVGPAGVDVAPGSVGEIWLQGPSRMVGYVGDDAATRAALAPDGWLRTGDLGQVLNGDMVVVGRLKDMILRGGRNLAPQDLERAAEQVVGVRKGCVAAFGVPDPATGTEAIVVVAETRLPAADHGALGSAIAARVREATDMAPDHVVIVAPGCIPKTSSGKLQRGRCRDRWQAGQLVPELEPGPVAMAKIVGRAFAHRVGARKGKP